MDKKKIKDIALSIEIYVKENIIDNYSDMISGCSDCDRISYNLKQLENRSKEFHNPSFVVLVVGPVKSGKSTFVNLVARNYVSPTHFLECTVRPSLISAGKEESLTVYRSKNPKHKEEQINSIIDCINGLNGNGAIADVYKEEYAYTEENVDRYIKLDPISVANDDILLTSIKTHGGKLLQEHVYLVDMAGFDGANVNFDAPAYKAIIERADLVVFVQSSNSAISKVSTSFFELLQSKNHSVPVCLVHNVFESVYWRDDESKKKDIEEQKEYAVSQIKSKYKLVLDSDCAFNLNLGKVYDWRKGRYVAEAKQGLEQEAVRFEEAEMAMYELFRKRESIRLVNCISRTKIQRDILLVEIERLIEKQKAISAKYDGIKESFELLKKTQINEPLDVSIKQEELVAIVGTEYSIVKKELEVRGEEARFKTLEARDYVNKFLLKIREEITKLLNQRRKEISGIRNCEEIQKWVSSILNNSAQYVSGQIVSYDCKIEDQEVDLEHGINVEQLVAFKKGWSRHSIDELHKYLSYVAETFCGFNMGADVIVKGYIEKTLYPQLLEMLTDTKRQVVAKLIDDINMEIERLKQLSLRTVISDYNSFQVHLKMLCELRDNVETLNIQIDE